MSPPLQFRLVTLDDLTIDDRDSFAGVGIYGRLEGILRRARHPFRIPEGGQSVSWDRTLFLNLTYWNADEGADVLCDDHIPADVVAHVGWHEVVSRELARRQPDPALAPGQPPPSAEALFLCEAIASAFDLYLVGRLLRNAPSCDFVTTQVPLMAECAGEAGLSEEDFAALLDDVVREPERAFEDLRALLFDAAASLLTCRGIADAQAVLEGFGGRRFAPLLHHYQLSNWILYARAYAAPSREPDAAARAIDQALRQAPDGLDWLDRHVIEPAAAANAR
ncbi:MAG TPA: hypothetical protein VHG72_00535 [Polyangia bacterium]|nr:hypothetical protein [Polyangia bacterium]